MTTGIFYYSSTGNSLDVANNLSKHIDSTIYFIPSVNVRVLEQYERIILVTPIYSFGLPTPVKKFIEEINCYVDKQYFCILHYGGFSGNAMYFTQNFFQSNELPLQAIYKMKMPENFTTVTTVPAFYIKHTLKKEKGSVDKIAKSILLNQRKVVRKNIFSFLDKIHWKNAESWSGLAQNYTVTDDCISCGYCSKICTQKNIEVNNGKPVFGNNCIACLGCYHRCPKTAINYGDKTIGRERYQNPNVDFSMMK